MQVSRRSGRLKNCGPPADTLSRAAAPWVARARMLHTGQGTVDGPLITLSGDLAASVPTGASARPAASWPAGTLLQAQVLDPRGAAAGLRVRIGNQVLLAQVDVVELAPGQRFLARVEVPGERPVLRVVGNQAAPASAAREAQLAAALRQTLPRQAPLVESFALLSAAAASTPAAGRALGELLAALPSVAKLVTAPGLRAALNDSGLLFEARIAAIRASGTQSFPGTDLKALLLRAVAALATPTHRGGSAIPPNSTTVGASATSVPREGLPTGSAPPPPSPQRAAGGPTPGAPVATDDPGPPNPSQADKAPADASRRVAAPTASGSTREPAPQIDAALRAAEASLARVEHNQLRSLDRGETPGTWHFELPLPFAGRVEALRIEIERRQSRRRTGSNPWWCVNVRTEIAGLGPVAARISLSGGKVAVALWATQASSARRINEALPALEQSLAAAGLHPGALSCAHGMPAIEGARPAWPELLEVHA